MKDQDKTKEQLVAENEELLLRIAALEKAATEGKRAGEELRREHQRAQQYLDVAGVIMVVLGNSGEIRLLNRKGYALLGYDNGDLLGKNWFDTCVPQRIRDEVKSVFSELMASRVAPAEYYENPAITRSGEERSIAWHNAVLTDDTGAIAGTLSSGLDITERKRAEEALRESEERFRQAMEATNDGLWDWNVESGDVYYSPAYSRILGYEATEFANRTESWADLLHPDDRAEAISVNQACIENRIPQFEVEFRMRTKGGEWRTILGRGKAVCRDADGRAIRMIGTHVDITERRRAEEELAKSKAILQAAIECLPFDFFAIGEDGRYLMENAVCRANWGRLTGNRPEDMAPNDEVRAWWVDNNRRAFAGEKVEGEATVTIKGKERIVCNILTPIRDETHSYGILGVNVDITERKRAEEALKKAHDQLERRVEERTVELTEANERLKREVEERKRAEEALRQSEERYRTVVEDQTEVICRFKADGTFTFVNDVYCRFFGKASQELLGSKWQPAALPEDLPMIEEHVRAMSPGNPIVVVENRVHSGVGEVRWMQFVNRGFFDQEGRLTEVQAVGRDITERKRAEVALRQSLDQLQAIHEGIIEGLLITDIETKRFVRVNSSMCRMLGYSEEKLLAASIKDIHPPEEVPSDLERFRTVAEGQRSLNEDRPVRRKDGSLFYADITGHPIVYEGRPCVLALFRDITERKQTQEALRQSHDELRVIYDEMADGIVIVDIENPRPIRVNAALCRMLGYSEEGMQTVSPAQVHPSEAMPKILDHLQAVAQGRVARFDNMPFLRRDGSVFYADVVSSRILYNERFCRISFLHDVTERKQTQEALGRERQSLWRMLQASDYERQTISYDIHDGLTQYLAAAGMQFQAHDSLREDFPNEAKKAYETAVELVRQAHSEARRLINEVRPPVIDETGLETAMAHLVHEQRRRGGPKIHFDSNVQFDRLPSILENALYRITQEALSNACKHSRSKEVKVTMTQDGQDVRLEVQDWGIGFDPESVEKGHFGLEGIRQRVRLLGGRLNIDSTPGSGTLVQVVVPIVEKQGEG